MATKRARASKVTTYEKVSATLERPVLQMIRERSPNVSEFLNQAAKDKLYFERIREGIREMHRQGVPEDLELRERIRKALVGPKPARRRR